MELPAMMAILKQLKVPMGLTSAELFATLDEDGNESLNFEDMVLELKSDLRLAVGRDSSQSPEVRAPSCYRSMAVEGANHTCTQEPEWKAQAPDTASGNLCLELELRIAEALKRLSASTRRAQKALRRSQGRQPAQSSLST